MLLVENVQKSYREPDGSRLPVLDVPRLEVAAGEQVVIRGRSGGGKTTLLNAISGLTTIDSGRVDLNGVDITRLPEVARSLGATYRQFREGLADFQRQMDLSTMDTPVNRWDRKRTEVNDQDVPSAPKFEPPAWDEPQEAAGRNLAPGASDEVRPDTAPVCADSDRSDNSPQGVS